MPWCVGVPGVLGGVVSSPMGLSPPVVRRYGRGCWGCAGVWDTVSRWGETHGITGGLDIAADP
jgi:hypothetical protein